VPRAYVPPTPPEPDCPWPVGAKLHIGCGPKHIRGWVNTDAVAGVGPDGVVNVARTRLPASRFQAIYACHVLEHIFPEDTPGTLARLLAALLPGGTLRLSVPDIRLVVANCVDSQAFGSNPNAPLFGDFRRAAKGVDRHRQCFWAEGLTALLEAAGFVNVREWRPAQYPEIEAVSDWSRYHPGNNYGPGRRPLGPISLNLEADKPAGARRPVPDVNGPPAQDWVPVDLSVILGTVDREEMLRECVEAVRASLKDSGITYEIVVAYGAATEPSLPWMREQADIRPICGGLGGAIIAFNRAYDASRGRYICQINDDVLVGPRSLPAAVRHLDKHPDAAAVVFRFDRGTGAGPTLTYVGEGLLHPNQIVIRREAAEAIAEELGAFWGDEEHRTNPTYGGDTALGMAAHHLGLRLVSAPGVECVDRMHEADDELRARNRRSVTRDHWQRHRALYPPSYATTVVEPGPLEWPHVYVPRPGRRPRRSPLRAGRPLRVLHCSLSMPNERQEGLCLALSRMGPYREVRWADILKRHGLEMVEKKVLEAAEEHQPQLIWAQIQTTHWPQGLAAAARAAAASDCLFVAWTGDVRTSATQPVERWMPALCQEVDIFLASPCTYVEKLRSEERVPCAVGYQQCGFDPLYHPKAPGPERSGPIFLGSNYEQLDKGARRRLFEEVSRHFPPGVTLYGRGWELCESLRRYARAFVPKAAGARLYGEARMAVSVSLYHRLRRYTSDRLKRALGAGACVAMHRFNDSEGLGIREGIHVVGWETAKELADVLADWTRPERARDRAAMRDAASRLAHETMTWDCSVEELLAIVRAERRRRRLPC